MKKNNIIRDILTIILVSISMIVTAQPRERIVLVVEQGITNPDTLKMYASYKYHINDVVTKINKNDEINSYRIVSELPLVKVEEDEEELPKFVYVFCVITLSIVIVLGAIAYTYKE
jgi:hypothetical protein